MWRDPRPGTGPGTVRFLADSFTSFTEPHIGRATIELLERAGWDVDLVSSGCCGRSALSKGLVDQAKASAADLVSTLASGSQESPIVGCEPSCLFTLRDETLSMLPGNQQAVSVAGGAPAVIATRPAPAAVSCSSLHLSSPADNLFRSSPTNMRLSAI